MRRHLLLLTLLLLVPFVSFSQETDSIVIPKSSFRQSVDKLVDYLKTNELNGVDTNYIGVPSKDWSVFANTYLADVHLKLQSRDVSFEGIKLGFDKIQINLRSKLQDQASLGLYYRGYGLSYSWDINKNYNKDLSFSMYSSPIGGEFRFHSTKAVSGDIKIVAKDYDLDEKGHLDKGLAKIESFILNAYYVFNSRKFSYNAAMSFSKYQKKSAGSVIAGFTVFQNRMTWNEKDEEHPEVVIITLLMGGVDRIKLNQWATGAGYAYNWVPAQGWNFHLSVLPMVLLTTRSVTKSTGVWSEEQKEVQRKLFGGNTHISYTYMLRSSISYYPNERFIFGLSGFYNHFRVGHRKSYFMTTDDWIVRAFVGVRF